MSNRVFRTKKDFENKFKEYIEQCRMENKLANIAGFCVFADINRDTFYAQKDIHSDTYKKVNEMLEDITINAKINDTFKIFYMKNKFNYKDKQENINVGVSYEDYIKKVEDEEEY